ncbi:MAG: MBL fold metallo-hydrolase [Thaumarchaeota archaeon]|nr:MBL fold metallo-hydrolase [Nitrososphaerota archaeon]
MGVKITCYGGVGQIGGNKILVEDRDTKVLLDFGSGFSEGEAYFSAGIQPRSVNGAGDYFEFGLLPEIEGLYSEEALQNTGMKHTTPEVDAILLSHYHYDHMGRINFVDPRVPVYCGETTKLIHEAQSGSTGSPLDGHAIETFRTGDKFTVGSIEVEPIHVDHSIPGAYGLILHTTEGPVAYTGDFRFHGPMGGMTEDFVVGASESKPLALLTEGTRVSEPGRTKELTEPEVIGETVRVLKGTENLVFSSFRGNDIDRVVSLDQACKETGRTLVVSTKIALLLEKLSNDRHLKVPKVGKDVLVYMRRKRKGNYDEKDYYKWEKAFLDDGITAEEVQKKQRSTLLHLDQRFFPELIDIKPSRNGAYIHATTEAFNEEGEREEEVIKNWVDYFGFTYHQIHASGHAPLDKVGYLVNRINGRTVIPIHTERPDLFSSFAENGRILSPKKGTEIRLA